MDRQAGNGLHRDSAVREFFRVGLLILFFSAMPFAQSASTDFRYDFMWPQLEQPWYFSYPNDVAVAPDGSVYVADGDNHRIQKFSAEGLFISTWGSEGSAQGQFDLPKGIAVAPDGTVLVTDMWNQRVQQFSAEGVFIRTWGGSGSRDGQFGNDPYGYGGPTGIAVAADGSVYVADTDNHRIQQFSAKGVFIRSWGSEGSAQGQFDFPTGIAMAADGSVYVVDAHNHRIQQFSAKGVFIRNWGSQGSALGEFLFPRAVAVASDGSVFVADNENHRIQQFSTDGTFLQAWGGFGGADGQFYWPEGIAVTSDGTLLVADSGNHRIQLFSMDGGFLRFWGSESETEGRFKTPRGIAIAPDGTVLVADRYNHRIQRFSRSGEFINTWGSEGSAQGQLFWPDGIAVGGDGSVFVADGNHRIQQFTVGGAFIRAWGSRGKEAGQFNYPAGIAVLPDGKVLVVDNRNDRVQQFSAKGVFIREWGDSGDAEGQFRRPKDIAVAADGTLLVADTFNHRIQQFSAEGAFIKAWGSQGSAQGQLDSPYAIAVAPDGTVLITDTSNNRVQQFSADGTFMTTWGGFGSGAGAFNNPQGIAVNVAGQVYVTEADNHRVQVFSRAQQRASTPKALIIAGRTAVNDVLDPQAQTQMIRQVVSTLRSQGYMSDASHDDLRVLWTGDPIQTGPDSLLQTEAASKSELEKLKPWASSAERLVLYLLGHGVRNAFYLNAVDGQQELLSAGELDAWLDAVQPNLSDEITLIYEACHAGSFLESLKGAKRFMLASAGADERALFGYNGINSYSYQFWLEVGAGRDLKTAHENAGIRLQGQSSQQPLLDANANAIGNERDDLKRALDYCLGIEVNSSGQLVRGCKGYLSPPPQIERVAEDRMLDGVKSAELWLTVNPLLADSITDAWVLLTRPDRQSDDSQSFDLLPIVTLRRHETEAGRWVGTYAPGGKNRQGEIYQGFDVQGDYQLAYYVKNEDGLLSTPLQGVVTQNQGAVVTDPDPEPDPEPTPVSVTKLINLSTRGQISAGDGAMVGGFVIQGSEPLQILIKGIGPSLAAAGLSGVLADPALLLHLNGAEIARNDDWEIGAQASQIRNLNPPADAREPALLMNLDPGVYTATVSGNSGGTGIGMVEINVMADSRSQLINLSTRGDIQAGDGAMVGGFVIQGSAPKQVLIKGVGPVLTAAGISGALDDPQLVLHAGGIEIAHNDDWQDSTQSAQISATHLQPANDKEPAILATLSPGAYTATVSGSNGATGIGMVEVYVIE